ncbi:glycosyltransferase family 2 protein [Actinoplanes sp. N902-109]|uniref:glycosyltransferase family 2 protein n=1 Tax=Actinoplanes sp. (strain N902-109) TaxID=649831 RepID=UPI0003294CE1|nr:cellulose synthase catalytic subunit [Actinoplanes sp. N902-109]AGL17089.1 family 2 glycosyl transferase [Actinoplanes sp. N902-109]
MAIDATPSRNPDNMTWRPMQRSTRFAVFVALAVTVFYMVFLLNPAYRGNTWVWILVLFAEGITIFNALAMWWTVLVHSPHPDPPEVYAWRRRLLTGDLKPTIDVFITVYGEPLEIVLVTVRAARDMTVEHKTWILDDGDSDEVCAAAEREGVGYLRRKEHLHAKAGNINAALRRTDGEFVVILDADHVPSPDFLVRALPHMQDRGVAFVQTPQAFPSARGLVAEGSSESQKIFYELVLPGRNYFNAVFCVGTNVIFRRLALEQIGGMYIASNSEDIWTSIELHRRGWRSWFIPEVLCRGLAPDSLLSYFKQQFRWAYGAFEVMLRGGLFRTKGLSVDQRFQYSLAGVNYLLSLAALVLMCLPAVYLLFGLSPIRSDISTWLVHYAPFYLLIMLVTIMQLGGFKPSAIVTSIAAAPVHVKALVMAIFKRKVRWTVTNAGPRGLPGVELVLPHVALLLLNLVAVAVGLSMLPLRGTDVPAVGLSIGWALIYVVVLGRVVAEAVIAPQVIRQRLERRKAGAALARALPWPDRGAEDDAMVSATVEESTPRS